MPNLAIDRGNTFAKVGVFAGPDLVSFSERLGDAEVQALVRAHAPAHVIVADVRGQGLDWLREAAGPAQLWAMSAQVPVPVVNLYQTPHTLGMDRLAAAIGAHALHGGQPLLVMDAGTCLTYDFVDQEGRYHGGGISPGLHMRFRALHHFTAKLPELQPAEGEVALVGGSTAEAIQSGVVLGMVAEIGGMVGLYAQAHPGLQVLMCGGDAAFLAKKVKHPIFVSQTLVVTGLNAVLSYNLRRQGTAQVPAGQPPPGA
jgi:type III pantothenate kinase